MGSQDITTPEVLPEGTTRVGPLVAWGWMDRADGSRAVYFWHWCDKSVWRTQAAASGRTVVEDAMRPAWLPSGVGKHDLISTDPLHLEPSVYCPDCCGLHGWIRDGQWVEA